MTSLALPPALGEVRVDVLQPAGKGEAPPGQRPIPWQLRARAVQPRSQQHLDVQAVREHLADWLTISGPAESAMRAALRARLVGCGPTPTLREEALACVTAKAQRVMGIEASDAQLICAQGLLDGHLMDMAHAEGKSLAIALAAAAFALAGEPVHVFVASDFLAARDARQHAALLVGLGLRVGVITSRSTPVQRQAAYGADVVYAVAADLARDHLRDSHHAAAAGEHPPAGEGAIATQTPLFPRGLCCALIDDADHVLLDEATTPLDLVEVHEDPDLHAACIIALALARRVRPDVDVVIDVADCSVRWTDVGLARVELLSQPLGEGWQSWPDRRDLLSQALVALHALHAEHDYVLRGDRVDLLVPGTLTPEGGRQEWPRTLQTLLEIKEGCRPSPVLRTVARTRLQRFFPLYRHLAGAAALHGDAADEVMSLYGLRLVPVARQWPARVQEWPQQVFEAACLREAAAVQHIKALQVAKRAVLVGVGSDDAARALSAALQAAGVDHALADGRDELQDARQLEAAAQPGRVTVLVEAAGRGLSSPATPELAAVGGLHVLDLLDTASARVRRRLLERAGVRGTAGTAETWHAADMPCWDRSWIDLPSPGSPQWMVDAACRVQQLMQRWSRRRERRRLLAEASGG